MVRELHAGEAPFASPKLPDFVVVREQLAEQGPDRRKVYGEFHRDARRDFAETRAAGVRILAGTDIGVLNIVPGRSMHDELALLVRDLGMTPHEALLAATVHAAAFMGLDREVGSIETGRQADMILLDANPLDDIAHISRISGVVLRGRCFDRGGLDKVLHDVMASPDVDTNDWPRKEVGPRNMKAFARCLRACLPRGQPNAHQAQPACNSVQGATAFLASLAFPAM